MANETDFLDLYRRLKVGPDCGLLEFKQAYRRHVSLLHPDRRTSGGHLDARAAELLQRLTAQYSAAMEFHRRHGRLPGAVVLPRLAVSKTTVPLPHHPLAPSTAARHSYSRMLVLLAVATMGILLWISTPPSPSPETAPAHVPANEDAGLPEPAAVPVLSLGMSPENVRAIEGDPEAIHDDRWEYGPSWISFDHDKVADWHSSPLHSLKTASRRPANNPP